MKMLRIFFGSVLLGVLLMNGLAVAGCHGQRGMRGTHKNGMHKGKHKGKRGGTRAWTKKQGESQVSSSNNS